MKKQKIFVLLTVFTLLVALAPVSASEAPTASEALAASPPHVDAAPEYMVPQTDRDVPTALPAKRWILQLEAPSLAQYAGGIPGYRATAASATGASRLDVNTPSAQAYVAYLKAEQTKVAVAVARAVPGAFVEHDYQIVLNGLTVNLPRADEQADRWLSRIPGVKHVFRDDVHYLDMYASLPLIDAPVLWGMVGGQAEAGKDIKIASIDTGIYPFNDCFDPTGYTYPAGYPLFDTDKPYTTTEKVIVARAYFRADDPPPASDEATWPGATGSSHGTHTSGSMACVPGTVATTSGYSETISGVAPAAYLMSYKVFYPTASEFSGSAFDAELIAAVEDAVADGADVVNNSWGEGASSEVVDALDLAYDAAWDAGVVVVFSAGNSGPYESTVDHPSDKNITVGASTTAGTIAAGEVNVTAPPTVPITLTNIAIGGCTFCPDFSGQAINGPLADVANVTVGGTNTLCDGETISPANALAGQVALISRGGCFFSDKLWNAQQAGAIGGIVYNNAGDSLINMSAGSHQTETFTIAGAFVGQTDGQNMVQWTADNPGTAEGEINFIAEQVGNIPDQMASFSSRGPSIRQEISPDVTAPGVNIFSSGYGLGTGLARHAGFGQVSGTSMSAPHVTGAAAVLKQLHPTWTPAQIKSALMSTAELDLADFDGSPVGALDRGAGRIDLGHAGNPGLTFDKPSLSFGKLYAGDTGTMTVMASDVFSHSAPFTYTLSISETGDMTTTDKFTLSVSPASLTFGGMGGMASFDVMMEIAAGADAGDYEGLVWLRHGPHVLHIPVWARVWPPLAQNPVLLIDNDFSYLLGFPDYTGYYTSTLEALGIGYDYYNADMYFGNAVTFPDISTLQAYQAVIWYTGDNYYPDGTFTVPTPPTEGDQDVLIAYLQSGGRLLATGQDLASTVNFGDDTGLYNYFLGADYIQDDVFWNVPTFDPQQVQGLSFASGITLDLTIHTPQTLQWLDGAGNQDWVDEVAVYPNEGPDVRTVPSKPFLKAMVPVTDTMAEGYVGLTRSSEPTLDLPHKLIDGRTTYLSFGFEGINDPVPGSLEFVSSREDLMGHLLTFLWAVPTVEMPNVIVSQPPTATLVANAGFVMTDIFHTAAIVEYQWDFGDGSPRMTTSVPTATHAYTSDGFYMAQVEVTDAYGHKAVTENMVMVGKPYKLYLPILARNN